MHYSDMRTLLLDEVADFTAEARGKEGKWRNNFSKVADDFC
jgi:hypothetical protein